jgi:hypothetical protein
MEYRWLSNDEIEQMVNPVLEQRNWMLLNISDPPTCRVLGAFDGVSLIGFFCLQLTPVLGPVYTDSDHRDGTVMRELADRMNDYMVEANARGAIAICESPVSERVAARHAMKKIPYPVYEWIGG